MTNRNRAIGYKDSDGNYGFVMYASGSMKIGNDSTDVIAMTGSLKTIGNISSSADITAAGTLTTAGAITANGQLTGTNLSLTTGNVYGPTDATTYIKSDGNLDFVIDDDNDASNRRFNWFDDTTQRMTLDQAGELELIGTGFVGDGTNLTNAGQLISQTIIDGASTTFSCESASTT